MILVNHKSSCEVDVCNVTSLEPFLEVEDTEASFGPDIPFDGILGYLIKAKPFNACHPIEQPPKWNLTLQYFYSFQQIKNGTPPKLYSYIALIQRSDSKHSCTFITQVKHAEQAGYSAAIVFNYKDDDERIRMGPLKKKGINISSVFVGYHDGMKLLNFSNSKNFRVYLFSHSPFDYRWYLVPFLVVFSVSIVAGIIIWAIRYLYIKRQKQKYRLPPSILAKIPIIKYEKGGRFETCPVCLEDFEENEKVRVLPCHHLYHQKCIDPWLLETRRICPVCKKHVFSREERLKIRRDRRNNRMRRHEHGLSTDSSQYSSSTTFSDSLSQEGDSDDEIEQSVSNSDQSNARAIITSNSLNLCGGQLDEDDADNNISNLDFFPNYSGKRPLPLHMTTDMHVDADDERDVNDDFNRENNKYKIQNDDVDDDDEEEEGGGDNETMKLL
ncbi:hypothetical protein SNEBB_002970 [Seison nebaliae]|nr:hypothetical protein SNEBB_002970 [Seison nebaliae]